MQGQTYDLVGRKFHNYTLEKLIGEGGMGAVYLARQERPRRSVAIKVLQPELLNEGTEQADAFLARFRREADVIAKLEHPNIIHIYEYGEENELAFLVMPYITGGSLREHLLQQGTLSLETVARYLEQAASALDYAHAQGIIHRDLKPANFLLHADGRLVLTDFGIARLSEESPSGNIMETLTKAGMLLGTPDFMAPEMVNDEEVDYRADIYELGIVLYTMLNGAVPFPASTPLSALMQRLQKPLPPLHPQHPEIPEAVDRVLQKATALRREERYSSLKEMNQAMRAAIASGSRSPQQPTLSPYDTLPTLIQPTGATNDVPILRAVATPQPSSPQAVTYQDTGNPRASVGVTYPATPAATPYTPSATIQRTRQRRRWPLIVLCLVVLVAASLFAGLRLEHYLPSWPGKHAPTTLATQTTHSTRTATAKATPTATTTPPGNVVPTGSLLYAASAPGRDCDPGKGMWTDYDYPQLTCNGLSTEIDSTATNKALGGIFLDTIPGKIYPSDYVVSVQEQPLATSTGDFGLYVRNQPGKQQLGTYTFLIRTDGRWTVTVYDNITGTPTELKSGSLAGTSSPYNLAVAADGSHLSFYLNNKELASINDETYMSGTAGIVVNQGADISVSQFALYTVH